MKQRDNAMLEKVSRLERDLQFLKVELLLRVAPRRARQEKTLYQDEDIVRAVKRIRRSLWNERYSPAA